MIVFSVVDDESYAMPSMCCLQSATRITTTTFDRLKPNPKIGRAEA
jgi:hypothetical protein